MMNELNEFNKNTRTLIVSFVVAIMALIPLRFVEVGQYVSSNGPMVLGETVESKIILPSADVAEKQVKLLEAPYDVLDGGEQVLGVSVAQDSECYSRTEAELIYQQIDQVINSVSLNEMQKAEMAGEILRIENNICR